MKAPKDLGASAVEFALVLPLLIIILGGAIEIGYLIAVRAQIGDALEEGVTVAAREPDRAGAVPQIVSDGVSITDVPPGEVSVTCAGGGVRVGVVHDHDWVSPFLFTASTTMTIDVASDVLSPDPCQES